MRDDTVQAEWKRAKNPKAMMLYDLKSGLCLVLLVPALSIVLEGQNRWVAAPVILVTLAWFMRSYRDNRPS